jgi:hypothetical protein
LREQFAGAAYERLALNVLVAAGALTDENELRFRIADTEDDLCASFVQFATRAIRADVFADALQAVIFDAFVEERRTGDLRNKDSSGLWR